MKSTDRDILIFDFFNLTCQQLIFLIMYTQRTRFPFPLELNLIWSHRQYSLVVSQLQGKKLNNTKIPIKCASSIFLKFFIFHLGIKLTNTKITKSDIISKTENRTKNIIKIKNERPINSNLPCKFGCFWRKLNFWGAFWVCLGACGTQTRYDVIWNFTPIIFLGSLSIFSMKMATSERGDLHILNCDRTASQKYVHRTNERNSGLEIW